jgi:hypothetical protein
MKKNLRVFGLFIVFFLFAGMRTENNTLTNSYAWVKAIVDNLEVSDYFLTMTPDGNLAITGSFVNKARFGSKALVSVGSYDIFVAKYTPEGSLLWLKQGGGSEFDMANVIRTDTIGNIYVTGFVKGITFFGDYILRSKGQRNVFTAKYAPNGELLWLKAEGADLYYETNPKKRQKIIAKLLD